MAKCIITQIQHATKIYTPKAGRWVRKNGNVQPILNKESINKKQLKMLDSAHKDIKTHMIDMFRELNKNV